MLSYRSTTCNLQGLSPTQKERTKNPVQKPNFRGHAGTKARTRVYKPPTVLQDHQGRENKRTSVDLARGEGSGGSRQQVAVGTSLGGSLSREWTPSMEVASLGNGLDPSVLPKNLASTIAKDSGTASAQPHPRSQMPKKPAPQKSLQQVASSYRKSVIEKKGKVREQVDLFLVAQRAQPVLCYHKKGGQKENLLELELESFIQSPPS